MKRRLKTVIYSSVGLIGTTAIIVPIAITHINKISNNNNINNTILKKSSQENNKTFISNLSTKWNDNTKAKQKVNKEFNYILGISKTSNFHYSNLVANNSSDAILQSISLKLNKLNTSQQSQIKNEMLKVYLNISSDKELTNKNYINNLRSVLPSSEIPDVIKYMNRNKILSSNQTAINKNSNLLATSLFYVDTNTNQTIQDLSNILGDVSDAAIAVSATTGTIDAIEVGLAWLDFGSTLADGLDNIAIAATSAIFATATGLASSALNTEAQSLSQGIWTLVSNAIGVASIQSTLDTLNDITTGVVYSYTAEEWGDLIVSTLLSAAISFVTLIGNLNIQ